jgi:hypothetical protein
MSLTEINLFGVYVAPISVMMVVAWFITIALRRFASRQIRVASAAVRVCPLHHRSLVLDPHRLSRSSS